MRPHAKYLALVARHKWFVFVAGLRVGVPLWRLVRHDFSKLGRAEWGPYVRRFISGRAGAFDHSGDPDEWHRAWAHHWHRNDHHWEHWLRLKRDGTLVPMRMSRPAALEMVADWMGAGRAYVGGWDVRPWYGENRDSIRLHPETRQLVESLIGWEEKR